MTQMEEQLRKLGFKSSFAPTGEFSSTGYPRPLPTVCLFAKLQWVDEGKKAGLLRSKHYIKPLTGELVVRHKKHKVKRKDFTIRHSTPDGYMLIECSARQAALIL